MQNQIFNQDPTSEEIYQEMTRDAFGVLQKNKFPYEENLPKKNFSKQIENLSRIKYEIFIQKLVNRITAQFHLILPGAFRITTQSEQCLSYANLHSWSPGRSYFSLFEMKESKSIWILHFSRSVGEGLAYLTHKTNSQTKINIFNDLREANSLIYLEIGEKLRNFFINLLELWPKSKKLDFVHCRHVLQLGFLEGKDHSEEYVVLPFHLDNNECSGDFHLILPLNHLKSVFDV